MSGDRSPPWGHTSFPDAAARGSSRLHYFLLPRHLRPVYLQIESAVSGGIMSIPVTGVRDKKEFTTVARSVFLDNPSLCQYTLDRGFSVDAMSNTYVLRITRKVERRLFAKYMDGIETQVRWYKEHTRGMNDYEKELFVHDKIARETVYDPKNDFRSIMLGPLIRNRGACLGISAAVMYILNRLGVDTATIAGTLPGQEIGHAWNLVNIDGNNYHLDVTFDSLGEGRVVHSYFNADDTMMVDAKHIWNENVACDSTRYSYYTVNNSTVNDEDDIRRLIEGGIRTNANVEMKMSRSLSRRMDHEGLLRTVSMVVGRRRDVLFNYRPTNNTYCFMIS